MQQTQPMQIAGLPLAISFFSNGCLVLQPMGTFNIIFDMQESGELVVISQEDVLISDKSFMYNVFHEVAYEPLLKQWLIAQNMQSPI